VVPLGGAASAAGAGLRRRGRQDAGVDGRVRSRSGTFGEPKTKRSRRTVPLSDDAIAALRAYRRRQRAERLHLGPEYADEGLVFCTQLGTPLDRAVVQAAFKRALARAGLPPAVRFHDLRHTAATLLLANGVDIPTAAILGHSQNSTTLNIYAHAVPSRLQGATAAIQRAIRGIG
jgi:integrase